MMSHRYNLSLCVMIWSVIGTGVTARGDWPTVAGDNVERLLAVTSRQISTLRASYTYSCMGSVPCSELLAMDLTNDKIDVMCMRPLKLSSVQPCIDRIVINGEQTWLGSPRDVQIKGVLPGSWQIEYYPPGSQLEESSSASESANGVSLLRSALTPYHILHKSDFGNLTSLPEGYTLQIDQWEQKASGLQPGRSFRAYRVRKNGEVQNEILYELDLSDGVRIYNTTVSCKIVGKMTAIYILQTDKFQKINDAWVPFRICETLVSPELKKYRTSEIDFQHVEINPILPDDAFLFPPTEGSLLWDATTSQFTEVNYPLEKPAKSSAK
jgi:hypothetical protein